MKNKKYFVFTLGCQMNIADSQRIAQKLDELGYKSAPEKEADLVIINACSVRQKAVDRIWGGINKWQKSNKEIFITGCVLPSDKKKLDEKNIKTFDMTKLPNVSRTNSDITIMTGCDNFCSYCAVPYTRGREISRSEKDILADVQNALKSGSKEILLLGQNVNSYKSTVENGHSEHSEESLANARPHIRERSFTNVQDDKVNNKDFIKLLNKIDNLPYNFTFNFMSSNPHDMSDELIECFANLKKWPRELHLAMQSGDDEILKKMNRKYSSIQYLKLIENLKFKIPNLKLTTDIIVGFPNETKKQFENTVKICRKIKFKKAYVSQYSPRPGTVAFKLKDDVPKEEKKRRWLILDQLINK